MVAHPDDEILGAGATIARLKANGNEVFVATMSESSKTREKGLKEKQDASHEIIGVASSFAYGIETMEFAHADRYAATRFIEDAIMKTEPDVLITHSPHDIHDDHRMTAQFVQDAARLPQRQTGYSKPICAILWMEIPSSTDWAYPCRFSPTFFSPVDDADIDKKMAALKMYDGVLRDVPHPRNELSIRSLARYRGGQCGAKYAEAFEVAYSVL